MKKSIKKKTRSLTKGDLFLQKVGKLFYKYHKIRVWSIIVYPNLQFPIHNGSDILLNLLKKSKHFPIHIKRYQVKVILIKDFLIYYKIYFIITFCMVKIGRIPTNKKRKSFFDHDKSKKSLAKQKDNKYT